MSPFKLLYDNMKISFSLFIVFFGLILSLNPIYAIRLYGCSYNGGDLILENTSCYIGGGNLELYGNLYIKNGAEVHLGAVEVYRLPITIQENSGTNLIDYQIRIEITNSTIISHIARKDCGDIRIFENKVDNPYIGTQGKLPYWIEECDKDNSRVVVWTKVNLTANSIKTIYLYYGNPDAQSESNGTAVFEFFDDFEGNSLDTSRWYIVSGTPTVNNGILEFDADDERIRTILTFSEPLRIIVKWRTDDSYQYHWGYLGIFATSDFYPNPGGAWYGSGYILMLKSKWYYNNGYSAQGLLKMTSGSTTTLASGTLIRDPSVWRVSMITVDASTLYSTHRFYLDNVLDNVANDTAYSSGYLFLGYTADPSTGSAVNFQFDYIAVAKCVGGLDECYAYEPTVSIGNEEVQLSLEPASIWFDKWKYRIPITIVEQSGNDLVNYQINITIDTQSLIAAGKMNADCSDIRFTYYNSTDGTEIRIPYWIEGGCNTTQTKIWIRVPYIPSSGSATVYMYYGNPDAQSESNGTAVFEFFDDFDDGDISDWVVIDTNRWSLDNAIYYSSPYSLKGWSTQTTYDYDTLLHDLNSISESCALRISVRPHTDTDERGYISLSDSSGTKLLRITFDHNGWFAYLTSAGIWVDFFDETPDTWYNIDITVDWSSKTFDVYVNGTKYVDDASWLNVLSEISQIRLGVQSGSCTSQYYVDNIIIRKYTSPEPAVSIGTEEVLGQDFHRYIYIYPGGTLYVYKYSAINEEHIKTCSTDEDCAEYDCKYGCTVRCDVNTGDLYYFCDDYGCVGGICQVTGISSLKCSFYQSCEYCSGETSPSPLVQDTVYDYEPCTSPDQTSCPYIEYTDTCIDTRYLNESYCSGSDVAFTTVDCDQYDCQFNCIKYCNTTTGDIYGSCDDYGCSNGACVVIGTKDCGLLEDCEDTCTDSDGGLAYLTAGYVIDYELCSAGDTSCPSTTYYDYCSGDTLYERYCSGNDVATAIKDCNDYDGYYCATGNVKEYRDYYCSSGRCTYTVTSSYDCDNNDGWYCAVGDVKEYRDYYCSGGDCVYTVTSSYDCDDYDGWYCKDSETKEYRDYYCSGGDCVYTSTSEEWCLNIDNCRACFGYYCYRCYNGACEESCSSTPLSGYTCISAPGACPA